MLYRQLGKTGLQISILSLGGSGYGGLYGEYDKKEAARTLRSALDSGINYIDTSPFYGEGRSETFIGRALDGVSRDQYYIGTKVGRYLWNIEKRFDFTADKIIRSIEESLQRLQLSYVDILQLHDIEFAPSVDVILDEALPAVQKLQKKGLCRFIGITGYPLGPLKEIIAKSEIKIDTVLSYCRLSLNDSSLTDHFDFFKKHEIALINASPVSLGLLTEMGVQPWNPALPEIKEICWKAVKYCKEKGVDITRLAVNYLTSFEEAVTTLTAISDSVMLKKNLDAVLRPLSMTEEEVKKELEEKFFNQLTQRHWEHIEVEKYWNTLKQLRTKK